MPDTVNQQPLYLKPGTLAFRYGFNQSTLRDWRLARTGPPYVQVNKVSVLYSVKDVEAWLEEHRVVPGQEQAIA